MFQEGKEPMPRCDMCGMNMPAGRLIRHPRMAIYDQNAQMRWRRRDVEIAEKCTGATFSFTGDDGAECFERVDYFNYLEHVLHRSDEDWT